MHKLVGKSSRWLDTTKPRAGTQGHRKKSCLITVPDTNTKH